MKKFRLPTLLLATAAVLSAEPFAGPIYEETFNRERLGIDYRSGGGLGGPSTGVSGKISDQAYTGVTENGKMDAAGLALSPIAPNPLSAFTCIFWYFLDANGPDIQVPLSTAGVGILLSARGLEVRIEHSTQQPKQYVFPIGVKGPHSPWLEPGRWIFAAFTWQQDTNTLTVYQGTSDRAVVFMRDMSRELPADPSLPRADLGRFPEVIGNTTKSYDRPLTGRMDNLRFFDRVLDRADLEILRLSDLMNESPHWK